MFLRCTSDSKPDGCAARPDWFAREGPVTLPKVRRPATIYDVAAEAGVSHQTVSRYLKGFEGIRPTTRERVARALVDLNYRPNLTARNLATSSSHRIAALTSDLLSAGPSQTLQGLASAARSDGYLVDIMTIDVNRPSSVSDAVSLLGGQDLAGVVAIAVSDPVRDMIGRINLGVPVYLDSGPADLAAPSGPTFNAVGIRLVMEHLLELGHRDILQLSGPLDWVSARNRAAEFDSVVREHGLRVYPPMSGDWSAASGYRAITDHPFDPRVTAVVASNDHMALGAIHALAEAGISVPGDVSVTGFDDIHEASYFLPSLTTVRIDFERQGTFVFEALKAAIAGETSPDRSSFMQPQLMVRRSTTALSGF